MNRKDILVYAGKGSSHSWTWLADLFESRGVHETRFLGSEDFVRAVESSPGFVIISGGDGFGIGNALSGAGFRALRSYIEGGGTYVGICAGAYLPLPSKIVPFSEFNLSSTKIENLDCTIRPLDNIPPRVAVKYGHCAIVHPVRGEVELEHERFRYLAPVYGGPIFKEPIDDDVLIRYRSFTPNTEFQILKHVASGLMLDKPAAIRASFGKGSLILLGPHLEHPKFQKANRLFFEVLGMKGHRWKPGPFRHSPTKALEKAVADLKVAILGLENRSFVVGKKIWDGSRYLDLLAAVEKRMGVLSELQQDDVAVALSRVRDGVLKTNVGIETDVDETTELLVETARMCVDGYFLAMTGSR